MHARGGLLLPIFLFSLLSAAGVTAEEGEVLYNGIVLPSGFPGARTPTQAYSLPPYITQPPAVIRIDLGRQLFVDDFLIENSTALTRQQHRPIMHPGNPVLRPSGLDARGYAMPFSDGVWFDPKDQQFKMWYFNGGASIAYATSSDGKNWVKPALPNAALPNTNVVLSYGGGRDSSTVWMDLESTNPAARFRSFVYQGGGLLNVFRSPDGIGWTKEPFTIDSLSDRTTMFWNPFRKVWVRSGRSSAALPPAGSVLGRTARSRYYAETKDFITFKPSDATATFWCSTDINDVPYSGTSAPLPELYNLDCVAYESLMLGMFSLYYPTPGPEVVELNVGFSRDGFNWVRPTRGSTEKAFIPVTNKTGDWNGFNTQSVGGCCLVVGDELWFYFSGRNARHGVVPTLLQTGLATLRRDGFYSMDAGSAEGALTTRTLRFSGSHLFVNLKAPTGKLQMEVLDSVTNAPIAPFTKANSIALGADKTQLEMKWSGAADLAGLAGRNVKFRFYLSNGSLYSFWVSNNANGASNGYVAAGGPGFTAPIDTVGNGNPGDTTPPSVNIITPSSGATVTGSLSVKADALDNVAVTAVQFLLNGNLLGSEQLTTPYQITWDTASAAVGTHTLTARARDAAGNTATSAPVTISVARANQPPLISSAATATPTSPTAGSACTLFVAATDADGDPLTYAWSFGDSGTGSGSSLSHIYALPGTYTARVTISDGRGGSATSSVQVTVISPTTPYTLSVDPGAAAPRQLLTVTWSAPDSRTSRDWIALYKVGETNTRFIWWTYTGGTASGSKTVSAPGTDGRYEFRYLTNNTYQSVATSNTVTVATVLPPPPPPPPPDNTTALTLSTQAALPQQKITVAWSAGGTRTAKDWIALYRVGDANTRYLWWAYTGGTATGSLATLAPASNGQYEFRYLTNNSFTSIAKSPVFTVGTALLPAAAAASEALPDEPVELGKVPANKRACLQLPTASGTRKAGLRSKASPGLPDGLKLRGTQLSGVPRKAGDYLFVVCYEQGPKKQGQTALQVYHLSVEP